MRRLIFYTAFFFFPIAAFTQQDSQQYNSLLWRITGNGLSKPSYLYGTMHLMDKRLFYFGDSLYRALEQSEGFAAELDISSMMSEYVNFMINDEDQKTVFLNEMVDEKKLDQYKTRLEQRFGKPVAKITAREIKKEAESRERNILAKGEMKTFMDAYLFDIASRQGKWTGGIEDFGDQMEILKETLETDLDDMFSPKDRTEKTIEWMINTYLKQDLDLIDQSDELWKGSKDLLLLKRNVKMSRRIDSLAHIRTCLFVIGAAHLPGDSGVISLLRKRGFILTPVSSSQKIAPEKYTYQKKELPWLDVETRDSLYSLQMPGKAEEIKLFEDSPMDMKMYFDMGNMSAYITMGIAIASVDDKGKDSLLKKMAVRYSRSSTDFHEKNITMGPEKGKEFTINNEMGQYRLQVFIPGNFVAINVIFALKKGSIDTAYADRFFQSFKPNHRPPPPPLPGIEKWQTYAFPNNAFSISLPGKYHQKRTNKPDDESVESSYDFIDVTGNIYYGIIVKEFKPGYYSNEDTAYFDRTQQSVKTRMDGRIISSRNFEIHGFPAYETVMESSKSGDLIGMRMLMLNRGNRRYLLLSTYEKVKPEVDHFFSSFSLLPLPRVKWQEEMPADKSFRVWSPSPVTLQAGSDASTIGYYIYDSAAPVSVYINKHVLSPYYWAANDSIMYGQRIKTFIGYQDSLIEYKKVQNGNVKGVDIVIRLGATHNLKKMRLLLNADTVYTVFGFLPKESLETEDYQKLFENFHITSEIPPVNLSVRKPAALLMALRSGDSTKFLDAKQAFASVTFVKEDLPLLQEALLYQYRDFDTSRFSSATSADIAETIIELDSNHSSVSFTKDNYDKIPPVQEGAKPYLLSVLSCIKTQESYDLLKDIIVARPPKTNKDYYFHHRLYDSLKLSRRLYPEIFSRAADPGLSWMINGVGVSLLDSNMLARKDILPYKDIFIAMARKGLARPKEELEENAADYYNLIKLLGTLNLPESNTVLNRFGKMSNRGVRMRVIIALLKNNQPVDSRDIYTLATTDEYRFELYEQLKKMGKLGLFPRDYLSQKHLGQSVLYGYATDDESPRFISYIGERTEMFMGKKQKFYLYKVPFDEIDSSSTYLGVAGPYSPDPKDLNSTHDATGVVWSEKFDAKQIDAIFKKYLAETGELLKANKKD
ncbi:MAG: TraB/GumN family protein [Bacteroidota bacterium]|nr:TraB/GumN family protein [Bacteroidota bacterium]